jgi:hypothetical protein
LRKLLKNNWIFAKRDQNSNLPPKLGHCILINAINAANKNTSYKFKPMKA